MTYINYYQIILSFVFYSMLVSFQLVLLISGIVSFKVFFNFIDYISKGKLTRTSRRYYSYIHILFLLISLGFLIFFFYLYLPLAIIDCIIVIFISYFVVKSSDEDYKNIELSINYVSVKYNNNTYNMFFRPINYLFTFFTFFIFYIILLKLPL
jgi:hypothetical protein